MLKETTLGSTSSSGQQRAITITFFWLMVDFLRSPTVRHAKTGGTGDYVSTDVEAMADEVAQTYHRAREQVIPLRAALPLSGCSTFARVIPGAVPRPGPAG